jgi:prenyltransferase beta subunit
MPRFAPSRSAIALIAALCLSSVCAPGAIAVERAGLEGTVRFMQLAQNQDGGFGGVAGAPSDPDFSSWVALALAAVGVNPQDQARAGGADVYAYLALHAGELTLTTDYERALLVVDAAGTDPNDFGGVDLQAHILERQLASGAFAHRAGEPTAGVNDTIFAILALSPLEGAAPRAAVVHATEWLVAKQYPDGSWPSVAERGEAGEVDMTGAALQALVASRVPEPGSQQGALAFLRGAQDTDGGFPEYPGRGEESNVASTAWAAQGIWAAGQDPEAWRQPSGDPLSFMESLLQPDGHVRFKRSADSNGVWMTAYVAPALAGRALPFARVPRSVRNEAEPRTASPASDGVLAGGGGAGASLFSRPQPQSTGRTRAGARRLRRRVSARPRGTSRHGNATTAAAAPIASQRARTGERSGARPQHEHAPATGTRADGSRDGAGSRVVGISLGTGAARSRAGAAPPTAPGLRGGVPADDGSGAGLAAALAGALALLALAGARLERRRPQVAL